MEKTRKKRGWAFWLTVLLGTSGMIVVLWFAALAFLVRQSRFEWECLAQEIRARGEALTYEDFAALKQPLPPEKDAASVIDRASRLIDLTSEEKKWLDNLAPAIPVTSPISSDQVEGLRRIVTRHSELFRTLGGLEKSEGANFSLPYDQGAMARTKAQTDLALHIRLLGVLLSADCLLRLVDNDQQGAIASISMILRLTGWASEESNTLLQLLTIGMDGQAVGWTARLLSSTELNAGDLDRLQLAWREQTRRQRPRWFLLGQRAAFIQNTDPADLRQVMKSLPTPAREKRITLWDKLTLYRNRINGVKVLNDLIATAEDLPSLLRVSAKQLPTPSAYWPGWEHINILKPSIDASFRLEARYQAYARATLMLVASERYRVIHGAFPRSAAELVPDFLEAIPGDPFKASPMLFVAIDESVVAYSVGENRRDDGGMVEPASGERLSRDFGFHLPPPEKRRPMIEQKPEPDNE